MILKEGTQPPRQLTPYRQDKDIPQKASGPERRELSSVSPVQNMTSPLGAFATKADAATNEMIPRDYQKAALCAAQKQNTFVVLDTGLGKTLVAQLLIKWHLEKQTTATDKLVVFLAPSREVLKQAYDTFVKIPKARVCLLQGKDTSCRSKWKEETAAQVKAYDLLCIDQTCFLFLLKVCAKVPQALPAVWYKLGRVHVARICFVADTISSLFARCSMGTYPWRNMLSN